MANNNIESIQLEGGSTLYPVGIRNVYVNAKGNLCIETSATLNNTSKGKINIEAMDDVQIKPGDDLMLYADHRETLDKQQEFSIKVMNGTGSDDVPIKLQLNAAELLLTTKGKDANANYDSDESEVFDVTVNSTTGTRGYLKMRARAIDLRCEGHGGIAIQPKGYDSDGHMNKIKFEHGGGDGLEFGTFNTEHTSLFTGDYRFNKYGIWRMATRTTEVSDKADSSDSTTSLKYVKQADDLYDVIDNTDEVCDTNSIIKTANAFNYGKNRHAKMTSGGNLEIQTNVTYSFENSADTATTTEKLSDMGLDAGDLALVYSASDLETLISDFTTEQKALFVNGTIFADGYKLVETESPKIKLISGDDIDIEAAGTLGLKGTLDFGSSFNFGETENGIEYQYKYTKKGATKDCGLVKVIGVNNSSAEQTVEGVTIAAGSTATIASASMLDIIKLVNYMKNNSQGPWAV